MLRRTWRLPLRIRPMQSNRCSCYGSWPIRYAGGKSRFCLDLIESRNGSHRGLNLSAWRMAAVLSDAEDDMVLETAVNGRADLVVTFNRRDFESAATFAVQIVSPADAVERLRKP
jgi:hypothetical protein